MDSRPRRGAVKAACGKIDNRMPDPIAQEIARQLSRCAPGSSICPSQVARALHPDAAQWRALMPRVREAAATLQRVGQLRITRGGLDVALDTLHHGAIRLAPGAKFRALGVDSSRRSKPLDKPVAD